MYLKPIGRFKIKMADESMGEATKEETSSAAAGPAKLADLLFQYGLPDDVVSDKASLRQQILAVVERHSESPKQN